MNTKIFVTAIEAETASDALDKMIAQLVEAKKNGTNPEFLFDRWLDPDPARNPEPDHDFSEVPF